MSSEQQPRRARFVQRFMDALWLAQTADDRLADAPAPEHTASHTVQDLNTLRGAGQQRHEASEYTFHSGLEANDTTANPGLPHHFVIPKHLRYIASHGIIKRLPLA